MKTTIEKLQEANKIISETKQMFKLQKKWWDTRREDDLDKLRNAQQRVDALIKLYEKPEQQL